VFKKFNSCHVTTASLLQKTQAVAADFPRVVHGDVVGSVVSDDVVNPVSQELNPAAFDEFAGFLMHNVFVGHAKSLCL
jgi:hypothetical protein